LVCNVFSHHMHNSCFFLSNAALHHPQIRIPAASINNFLITNYMSKKPTIS
jgi:hypothetical protein